MATADERALASGVTIAVTFPLGRYHATALGSSANDGVVEWPPSPWRLLRTLYSVWKTRCADLDEAVVERLLSAIGVPPQFHLDERTSVGHTRHYMPGESSGHETTALVHDTFVACSPDRPTLWITWPDVELDDLERSALERLCAAITWLGRAESFADARLLAPDEASPEPNSFLVPDSQHDAGVAPIRLLVPATPLDLESLTVRLSDLRADARTRATLPPKSTLRTFVRPDPVTVRPERRTRLRRTAPTAVRFAVVPNEAGRSRTRLPLADALIHTAALRRAAMALFGSRNDGAPSPCLSGRRGDERASGHGHAHYVPIPGDGVVSPRDRIDTFVVWAPDGLDDAELAALRSLRTVRPFPWLSASRPYRVIADGVGNIADLAPQLCERSDTWTSVTPVVAGRHPKGQRSWAEQATLELVADCEVRGLATPDIELRAWEGRFTTSRPRDGKPPHRSHPHRFDVTLRFPNAVGSDRLICLGAQSHFGLGLFRPA